MSARVLIVDDDADMAEMVARHLAGEGFTAAAVTGGARAIQRLADEAFDVVLTDVVMGEVDGLAVLREAQRLHPRARVILMTAFGSLENAIAALREGAADYLTKPFKMAEVTVAVRRALDEVRLREENKRLRDEVGERYRLERMLGNSRAMKAVLEQVGEVAASGATVLLLGESGTGKELVARAIHDLSPRSARPFIAVNCAALAESLLESELFGHEKGSFTGATSLRKGRFEIADRGTLFLDEVAEMPTATQVKLLRVLEEREFMRVGGSAPIKVDVRVIAATNKNLEEEVRAGTFRRDLYYRLAVLSIRMPPLRERREDIPLLIHHFVQEFCRENDREFVGITDEAMEILQNYDWPGNVRELRNLVESMLVLTPGSRIRPRDIPADIFARANPLRLLPVALADGEGEESGPSTRRVEALLSYFYRDLKTDLDAVRHEQARLREMFRESSTPQWLDAVEVESNGGAEAEPDREAAPVVGVAMPEDRVRFEVGMSLEDLEKEAIARTLASVDGNRRRAADMLGIGERTLYRKLKQYGL
jgi:DNA-binding NtrC family response regulator